MTEIYPFAKREGAKKGIIQNINFQLTTLAESRIQTTEEKLFTKQMYEDAVGGASHTVPIATNFKILKHLSISAGGTYREIWTPNAIAYRDYNETDGVVKDTIKGFKMILDGELDEVEENDFYMKGGIDGVIGEDKD